MPGTLPTVLLAFACDDIRVEALNKYSLMGIYGNTVVLSAPNVSVPKLCFVEVWQGGQGVFKTSSVLLSPKGITLATADLGNITIPPPGTTGPYPVFTSFFNLTFAGAGDYIFQIWLDGNLFNQATFKAIETPR